jgi:hypothetical protein
MASQINPNDIDGEFPVAGQPNNTQGFRDNFTNTKLNFQYASSEITELQTKAVLKEALAGSTLDNNMNDALIYAAKIQDFSATLVELATTSGTVAIDYSAGHYQRVAMTGNISLSFSNWPAVNSQGWMRLQVIVDAAGRTMTLPAAVSLGTTGIQGISGSVITFATAGTFEFEFTSNTGGQTITIYDLNRPLNVFTNGLTSSSATAGIGYTTGAGNTATQATNKTTAVTLNNVCGEITLAAGALAAGAANTFVLTNSAVGNADVMIINHVSGGTIGAYVFNAACNTGTANITVTNITSGSLNQEPKIRFAVIKGATG